MSKNDEEDVEFYLKIRNGGVFGFGDDDEGRFYIHGFTDPAQSCICFTKSYLGQHQVHYNGCLITKNHIIGTWVQPGHEDKENGKFDIKFSKAIEED